MHLVRATSQHLAQEEFLLHRVGNGLRDLDAELGEIGAFPLGQDAEVHAEAEGLAAHGVTAFVIEARNRVQAFAAKGVIHSLCHQRIGSKISHLLAELLLNHGKGNFALAEAGHSHGRAETLAGLLPGFLHFGFRKGAFQAAMPLLIPFYTVFHRINLNLHFNFYQPGQSP